MKRILGLTGALSLLAASAIGQTAGTTVTTLFQDDPDVRAFTGATDSDPNCLQVLSDGRIVFFESESTAGNNAEDSVILFDPAQSGTARFTVIASELALASLISEPSPVIFGEDMTIDNADNVYILAAHAATGGDNYFVARIPSGPSGYGVPELIAGPGVAPSGIPPTEGHGAIDYDVKNNRLVLLLVEDVEETALTGIAGLYTLPTTSGSVTPLSSLAPRSSMISVLTPVPSTETDDRGTFEDITVLPNGDIVSIFNVRQGTQLSGDSDGDVIVVTDQGTPSLLIDATTLSGDVAAGFGATTAYLDYNTETGNIGIIEEFTSVVERNAIVEYTTAGTYARRIADSVNLLENTGSTDLRIFSRAFDSDSDGNYYIFTGLDNESCQKIEHEDVMLNVETWSIY